MNKPQPPRNMLALAAGVAAIGAAGVYMMSPPSKVTGVVGKEDSATAAGHRKEGVKQEDANPKMQKADVREKAL
ncbi:hypothetical protein OH77DRAFT_1520518 [Trametes cingulata]|nr:hypothetical protein OH77DRAFT_1520518 [Trametes cingulata]